MELWLGMDDGLLMSYGLGLEERPNWVMLWWLQQITSVGRST